MATPRKKKATKKSRIRKGARAPSFVTINQSKKCTHLHFPVAAHPIEKRLMAFYFLLSATGFGIYAYLKPDTALLTEGIIPYQLAAFIGGCIGFLKFTSLIVSRFYIRIGKVTIDLYYGPLARRKVQRLHSERLEQIYVEQVESMLGYKYYVKAITKNQKEHTIYATYHNLLAKYIEYTLESYLGITNKVVNGEYQSTGMSVDEDYI